MKKRKSMKKRFAALAMAVILAWTTVDMPIVAAGSQDVSCEHHVEHTAECGYAEGEDGLEISPCIFECEECANASNDGSDTVSGNEVSDETTECTCETDDPAFHATNCPAYIAPENPQCFCAEKCTDDTLNVWCDVCGVQGVSACQGEDTAVAYEIVASGTCGAEGNESSVTWSLDNEGTLTISGTGAMADYELVVDDYPYHYTTPWHNTDNDGRYQNSNIKKVVVEEGVTHIGSSAFKDFTKLTSISIPNTVKSIGYGSISYCEKLTSLVIPNSVTSIGEEAFYQNMMLTSVTIGNRVESIGGHAFYRVGCNAGTNFTITLPKSVTSIAPSAFTSIYKGATIRYSCSYNEGNGYSTENNTFNATLKQYHLYEYSGSGNKINCSGCTCGKYSSSTATLSLSSDEPIYYTGEEIKPAVTVSYPDDWVGDEIEPSENNCTYSFNINAGTATCTFKYAEGVEASLDFTIEKVDSVITAAPTPIADLVEYNGTAHNLINAGTATGGEMQYSLDGTNYLSAIPTGTDAKTYTVWYKVDGDENHNDTEPEKVEVTIAPKTVEISSVTAINRAFDGTNTVEISEVIVEGILDEDEDKVSVSATAAIGSINAGVYNKVDLSNITLTGSAASNYSIATSVKDVPLTTPVTISKAAAPTLPSGSKAYVYSIGYEGESVSITGLPTDCGEVTYSLQSMSSDMLENVSVDANGKITYDVKELDSYTDDLQGTISVNVVMKNYETAIYTLTITRTEKIPQNISAEDITLTYGDADATISVTGAKTELSYEVVEDSNDNGYVVTVDANGKVSIENAGTAIIKITAEASDTYAESECEIRVTVNKRPVNIKAENYTVKKGDKLPVFEYNVTGLVNDETLPITVSIACTASDTNTVGTYDITVSGVSSEGNYTYIYTNGVLEVLAEDEAPFIMGDDGKMGWDAISDEIADAETGDEVVVDMNGATVVPGDIIEEARDKDITITFVVDEDVSWTIDGGTVADGDIGDINFGTTIESEDNPLNNIPVDVINNITGEKSTIEVNLAYSGEFGFTAVLTTKLSSANAGYYANLFYYNPTSKELEFVCADVIADDGTAELTFTHASDYLIVIDDEDLGVVKADVTTTETITDKNADDSAKTGDNTPLAAVMVMMMISVMGLIFGNKKKRNA